jgi:hypothetical protein
VSDDDSSVSITRPTEPDAARTTIVGGRPPGNGVIPRHIPRGLEVLIKKAAVDPAFKKLFIEKRAEAAKAIALDLEPAEAAMLKAVPETQLRAIVANTKVSPGLRPAFVGYAAAAMLAALGASAYAEDPGEWEMRTTGIEPDIPPETYDRDINEPQDIDVPEDAGAVTGFVCDGNGRPIEGALVVVKIANLYATTGENGSFVINNVPPGVYPTCAYRIGHEDHVIENVEIKAKTITRLQFRLNKAKKGTTYITGIMPDTPPPKKGD